MSSSGPHWVCWRITGALAHDCAVVLLVVAVGGMGIAGAALATAALVVGLVVEARRYPVPRSGQRPVVRRELADAVPVPIFP